MEEDGERQINLIKFSFIANRLDRPLLMAGALSMVVGSSDLRRDTPFCGTECFRNDFSSWRPVQWMLRLWGAIQEINFSGRSLFGTLRRVDS